MAEPIDIFNFAERLAKVKERIRENSENKKGSLMYTIAKLKEEKLKKLEKEKINEE